MATSEQYNKCTNCLHQPAAVPYIVHESAMCRMERMNKRLWMAVVLLVLLLTATNGLWVWYESQYVDEVTTTYEQETDDGGSNFIIGRDYNG